jgi:hypothetical protein
MFIMFGARQQGQGAGGKLADSDRFILYTTQQISLHVAFLRDFRGISVP